MEEQGQLVKRGVVAVVVAAVAGGGDVVYSEGVEYLLGKNSDYCG